MKKTIVTFWGVRGSAPTAGPDTAKYGGNTPCVEIESGNTVIICDAGTGIRQLGHDLIRRAKGKKIEAVILLSHLHLDHIIGLPFFKPIYKKGNRIRVMSPGRSARELKTALTKIISPPYFPINIWEVSGKSVRHLVSDTFPEGRFKIGDITVETFKCNHPDNSYTFKFRLPGGKVIVYASDNEPSTGRDMAFIRWLRGADILIHDAQYTPAQYKKKVGWGHSPYTYPIKLAAEAGVKKLILFHYDPQATDKELDLTQKEARRFIRRMEFGVRLALSRESMKISI